MSISKPLSLCNTNVMALDIIPISAFSDNYIWLLRRNNQAVVVDPGDAAPVLAYLRAHHLSLAAILITHHHADHIDGVAALQAQFSCETFAPAYEKFDFTHQKLHEGDVVELDAIGERFEIWHLPGHTLGHIAYLNTQYLFCGDVLFGAGCGRLFEGTPAQMFHSLNRLKTLPPQTQVFCTHEYTANNIAFAKTLEPNNAALAAREQATQQMRAKNIPSLPSNIGLEMATNPFLRCQQSEVAHNSGSQVQDELSVFCKIREKRNLY